MSLKNKWNKLGIKRKILIFSSCIITCAITSLYLVSNIIIPKLYYNYLYKEINKNIDQLTLDLESSSYDGLLPIIDEFALENNIRITIISELGDVIYSNLKGKLPTEFKNNKSNTQPLHEKGQILTLERTFYLKDLDIYYKMIVNTPIKIINEGEKIAEILFPFAFVMIVIVAITISFYYSKKISNPLIEMKDIAEKMAALDFSKSLQIKSQDELGELSACLNSMSKSLSCTIKELEDVNSKLRDEIEREKELERERKDFIATISHELKSPITILSGQIEGMIYNIGKYKDRDTYLKETYKVVENMRDLVIELLDISKRDKDDFAPNIERFNLTHILRNVLKEHYYFIDINELILDENIEEGVFIEGDEELIKKVIANLVKNAIQHSPSNNHIIVKLTNESLTIKNTGVTIPEEEFNNIFKAFYRLDKARNRKEGNTGLGLYIVKNIIDKHENIFLTINSGKSFVEFFIKFDSKEGAI